MNPFSVSPWQSAAAAAGGGSVDPSTLAGSGTSSNSSGNTTVSVGSKLQHTEVTTISGAATTRIMIVETVGPPVNGARLSHRLILPATAGITIEWRSGSAGGPLITSMVTDASGDDAKLDAYFDGSAWQFDGFDYPSNT